MSNWYTPEKVYVIRDRKGNFAPRTKIYPSKSGASNGRNSFLDGFINYECELVAGYPNYIGVWIVYQTYKNMGHIDRVTLQHCDIVARRFNKSVTQIDINKFYDIIESAKNEWQVEEIVQHYV